MCLCMFSCVQLFTDPWTVAQKPPLSSEFSSQKYWSELPFPAPGIKPASLESLILASKFYTTSATRNSVKPLNNLIYGNLKTTLRRKGVVIDYYIGFTTNFFVRHASYIQPLLHGRCFFRASKG